jgi:hypothetical protein
MLLLMVGLVVAGGGAVLCKTASGVGIPAVFIAIGAPFVALALHSGNIHLLQNTSSSTGKLYAGIFGACFVIAGAAWGAIAGRNAFSRLSGGSRLGGLFATVVGVGVAFAIAASVASAIGTASPPAPQQVNRGINQPSTAEWPSLAGTRHTHATVTQAQAQAEKATKLAECVTAAGTNAGKIQACEAKYMP